MAGPNQDPGQAVKMAPVRNFFQMFFDLVCQNEQMKRNIK